LLKTLKYLSQQHDNRYKHYSSQSSLMESCNTLTHSVCMQLVRGTNSDVQWDCACDMLSTAMALSNVQTAVMNRQTVEVS